MTTIKPVAVLTQDSGCQPVLNWHPDSDHENLPYGPLYAIPEGYHIVAIDHEQEMLDNIELHNEKVRNKKIAVLASSNEDYDIFMHTLNVEDLPKYHRVIRKEDAAGCVFLKSICLDEFFFTPNAKELYEYVQTRVR